MGSTDILLDEIIKLKIQLRGMFLEHFATHELFSWVWWLLIALIIIPLAVWWRFVDKKRLVEIMMFGLLIGLCAVFLDVLGSEMMLWEYPVHVLPQVALLLPVDFVVLPVIQMGIYQRYSKWKGYIIVSVIAALTQSFVAEPIAAFIGQYKPISWKYIYSVPIYLVINICVKLFIELVKKRQAAEIDKANPK
ncbi:MAG: CBO0543 family protein [Bacillota bacterium]